jgi:hypothetical protein
MTEQLDKYLTANKLWSMEGDSGVRKFTQVVREVCGYQSLDAFLADNPGALTAMMEFVGEWVERNEEWRENLAEMGFGNEEDADEENGE